MSAIALGLHQGVCSVATEWIDWMKSVTSEWNIYNISSHCLFCCFPRVPKNIYYITHDTSDLMQTSAVKFRSHDPSANFLMWSCLKWFFFPQLIFDICENTLRWVYVSSKYTNTGDPNIQQALWCQIHWSDETAGFGLPLYINYNKYKWQRLSQDNWNSLRSYSLIWCHQTKQGT